MVGGERALYAAERTQSDHNSWTRRAARYVWANSSRQWHPQAGSGSSRPGCRRIRNEVRILRHPGLEEPQPAWGCHWRLEFAQTYRAARRVQLLWSDWVRSAA